MSEDLPPRYQNRLGTLTDTDIRGMAGDKKLITQDFHDDSIKQACYELRASDVYYRPPNAEPFTVPHGESIIIGPKELVVIIVMETVTLPPDMLGRILTKGQLFSLGLSSVNTYADPGFDGRLGIVLYNTSTRYITISPGVPIAKMEFTHLEAAVKKPYKGQHGYQTKLWPIKSEYYLKDSQVAALRKEKKLESAENAIKRAFGADFSRITISLISTTRKLFLGMIIYLVCTIVLVALSAGGLWTNTLVNLGLGVVSSVIATLIVARGVR